MAKVAARKQDEICLAPGLMTHVVLGFPSLRESIELALMMGDLGVCGIELQIPFSDPIADGPTIMHANEVALAAGVTLKDCLAAMEKLSQRVSQPLYAMSYANRLMQFHQGRRSGVKLFLQTLTAAGVRGAIVPDLPIEEIPEDALECLQLGSCELVPVIAPTSLKARQRELARQLPSSFVYCMSTTGTTGARQGLPAELDDYLHGARRSFKRPTAVGFGISSAPQVRAVRQISEIAVVGSGLIQLLQQTKPSQRRSEATRYVKALVAAAR